MFFSIHTICMINFKINLAYIKVLDTIYELNQNDCYPLNQGIYKILSGKNDDEGKEFSYIKTYGTLISTTSKKICNYTLMLTRHGYIEKFYHYPTEKLYFKITEKGIAELLSFHKKSKSKYSSTVRKNKPTILKLSNRK